jgi:hypothetical protein
MKIVEFTASNVKRLRAVDITPAEHVQVIAGRNAQGKSSVLDAIWLALGGGAASKATAKPVRDGQTHASVRLDLGDLIVTRTWADGKTALKVESAAGAKFGSPQKMLDDLVGRLSFDPLAFTHLTAREQVTALLDLVDLGIDLDELAARRQAAYDTRTEVGRTVKSLEGQADGLGPVEASVPDVEVSLSGLLEEYRKAESLGQEIRAVESNIVRATELVADRRAALAEAEERLANAEAAAVGLPPVPDLAPISARIGNVEETNTAVRANQERTAVAARLTAARAAYAGLDRDITTMDREKSAALALAEFPIDGLGFTDDGVTYQGVPFTQASSAEQIRVSLAMAMALNPQLRVIRILDGSLLDADNLALIGEMARDNDYQVWIERVGDGDGIGVVIEDGGVLVAEAVA